MQTITPPLTRQQIIDELNYHNTQSPAHAIQSWIFVCSFDELFSRRGKSDEYLVFQDVEINQHPVIKDLKCSPDISIIPGLSPKKFKELKSYSITKYGVLPMLAIEIANSLENELDYDVKTKLYEQFPIDEYWIIDLQLMEITIFNYDDEGESYKQIQSPADYISPQLGVGVQFVDEMARLIYNGEPIPLPDDLRGMIQAKDVALQEKDVALQEKDELIQKLQQQIAQKDNS